MVHASRSVGLDGRTVVGETGSRWAVAVHAGSCVDCAVLHRPGGKTAGHRGCGVAGIAVTGNWHVVDAACRHHCSNARVGLAQGVAIGADGGHVGVDVGLRPVGKRCSVPGVANTAVSCSGGDVTDRHSRRALQRRRCTGNTMAGNTCLGRNGDGMDVSTYSGKDGKAPYRCGCMADRAIFRTDGNVAYRHGHDGHIGVGGSSSMAAAAVAGDAAVIHRPLRESARNNRAGMALAAWQGSDRQMGRYGSRSNQGSGTGQESGACSCRVAGSTGCGTHDAVVHRPGGEASCGCAGMALITCCRGRNMSGSWRGPGFQRSTGDGEGDPGCMAGGARCCRHLGVIHGSVLEATWRRGRCMATAAVHRTNWHVADRTNGHHRCARVGFSAGMAGGTGS